MSTAVLPGQMSVDEFLARPEREDGLVEELIEGEVVLSPNVKKGHNDVVSRIGRKLLPLEEQGFVVRGEVACRLSPRSLPNTDACVFRRDRWDVVDDEDFVREAPLLAIEVVSPGNRNPKLLTKADLYLRHGAEQVWLVYPRRRTVTVLSQDGGNHEVREGEGLSFGGLRWDAAEFFR